MAFRRYRRKRSAAGGIVADTAHIANRLSWKGAAVFGVVSFIVLYWLFPMWLNAQLNSLQGNMFRPFVEAVFARRIHWVQWVGIAVALICAFFAIRNYFISRRLGPASERDVGFLSRILAKWLD